MQEEMPKKRGPKGPRGINVVKRGNRIKEEIDALVAAILSEKKPTEVSANKKLKFSDIDLENEDLSTLLEYQAKLSKIILDKSKKG